MIKVISWIVIVWSVIAVPYIFSEDMVANFFAFVYLGLILAVAINNVRK